MDLSSIAGISSSLYNTSATSVSGTGSDDSFSTVLSSMMSALSETNDLQNAAESA
jgi:hypothetical protein